MPSFLLDTHVLLWWLVAPERLSRAQARALLELEPNRPAAISAISLWELAKMVERGRLEVALPLDIWLEEIEAHPLLTILPLTARIAAESIQGD